MEVEMDTNLVGVIREVVVCFAGLVEHFGGLLK